MAACARLSCASGMPTNSTARAAASATTRPLGSAMPTGPRQPDVSRRENHQAACNQARVPPRRDHARQPVERGVDVGAAQALDERREHVVVLVVAVAERAHRDRGLAVGEGDRRAARLAGQRGGNVERRERVAGVTLGAVSEVRERVVVDREVLVAEATQLVGERALQEGAQLVGGERLQAEEGGAREQRTGEREERILRRRADENEQPFFNVGQQRVLLGTTEPVHLVEEQDGSTALLPEASTSTLGGFAHVLHAGGDRRQRLEGLAGGPRDRRAMVVLPVPGGPQ